MSYRDAQQKIELYCNLTRFPGNSSHRETNNIPSESYVYVPFKNANKIKIHMNLRNKDIPFNPARPDYPVVHLKHLMITDPTDQSGIRPNHPVVRHGAYTDWPRLDGRVGVCVMALRVEEWQN